MRNMIETRIDVAENLKCIEGTMSRVLRDLDAIRNNLDEGSMERIYFGCMIDNQEKHFKEMNESIKEIIYYMETGQFKDLI